MAEKLNNLALFDFDGTLTTKDTLIEFIKFCVGARRYLVGMVVNSPMLIAFKLKLIPNDKAKERLLYYYLKNFKEEEIRELAREYSLAKIDTIINKKALKKLSLHKSSGDRVVVVSASMECWLKPWCDREKIELISTKLKFRDGKFSGDFDGKNCHGKQKAIRVKEMLDLNSYERIYAYGDSKGDKQMLELATDPHYRVF